MKSLIDINIEKSRSGVYKDNPENRRLHRVGQRYGSTGGSDIDDLKRDKKEAEDALKQLRKKESLYVSYQGGDEKYNRAVQSLKNKIDTLGQEITRRNAGGTSWQRTGTQSTRSAERAGQIMREGKKTAQKKRIEYGKKYLSDFLNKMGVGVNEKNITHNLRSDGADGLHYVSGGHVPVRASYYPSENKLVFAYPNVRSRFAGNPTDQGFKEVIKAIVYDRAKNNPVKGLDKMSVEELQRNIQETMDALKTHEGRKELFEKYQVGKATERDDRWTSIQERLERKLDGLQKEYNKREASAKKIDEGVRASEERRNLEEIKTTNKKVNEAIKQSEGKFSRVNLPDIPNAHKVNLAKYLSAKRKKAVDDAWDKAKFDSLTREKAGVYQEGYNKLREQFNNNFDDMSKSERAELLYKILKMKNAMEKGSVSPVTSSTKKEAKASTKSSKKKVPSGIEVEYDDSLVAVYNDKGEKVYQGIYDYSPYRDEDEQWNEREKNYDLPNGYKMVGLKS